MSNIRERRMEQWCVLRLSEQMKQAQLDLMTEHQATEDEAANAVSQALLRMARVLLETIEEHAAKEAGGS